MHMNNDSAEKSDDGEPQSTLSPTEFRAYNRLAEKMDFFVSTGTPWAFDVSISLYTFMLVVHIYIHLKTHHPPAPSINTN